MTLRSVRCPHAEKIKDCEDCFKDFSTPYHKENDLRTEVASICAKHVNNKYIRENNSKYWTMIDELEALIQAKINEARIDELEAVGNTGRVLPMSAKSGESGKWISLEERIAQLLPTTEGDSNI